MKIKQLCFVSGVALATLGTSAAQAALVVVPPGLAPGAQYRLVFMTDGTRDATSTDINDYNTFVTNQVTGSALANALSGAGLTTTWKAIGSTSATSAKVNTGTDGTQPDVPIYLINGNKVANNNADLWDGSLQHPINLQPNDVISSNLVWTGSVYLGTGFPQNQLGGGGFFGSVAAGQADSVVFSGWIAQTTDVSSTAKSLYAMSSVLTVPGNQPAPVPVPEPASLLGFITLGGLMLGGAVRKARK
ncbi:MAG: PEP-CTERM sorting domain-containing protein [bacterium]